MTMAIETRALRKRYGSRTALHGLDLRVEPGTVFGLIGPNGYVKTTTLRLLLDIIRPSDGDIRVLGADPRSGGAALRRRIGFVPGELRLEGRVTGRRLLQHYAGISGGVRRGRIDELADRLGLDLSRQVRKLSKGNKQKVGLVQAFMHDPELLVLDEPTSGLDPLVQREFLALVREAREAGQTVLLSSHILSEIQQVADDVAVLNQGRVVAEGDVDSLRIGSLRRLRLAFADLDAPTAEAALAGIPGVRDLAIDARGERVHVTATVDGDLDPVVKAIARHRVVDLALEEPDLEESVLALYGDRDARAAGTGARG